MRYQVTLSSESLLLVGSGEGGVLIDADVVFHPAGFPYIPAKRFKGLLKESLQEVLEIMGKEDEYIRSTVLQLFGKPGAITHEGKLVFRNFFLEDWQNISEELSKLSSLEAFYPERVKAYFTTEVQQTAIDENGIAKKRSLRNYRTLKPGLKFEGTIGTISPLDDEEWELLQRSVANLRFVGTRRNRGFGRVKCSIAITSTHETSNFVSKYELPLSKVDVKISTLSPVILAQLLGEQNTVSTAQLISGNQLRGLLASAFIQARKLESRDAHLDPDFFELFLSGNIRFGNLKYRGAQPIPLHLHQFKHVSTEHMVSVFSKPEGITKPVSKMGKVEGNFIYTENYVPQTRFNFHGSRENREAGRNTQSDTEGGIFYYESINENQEFLGEITGAEEALRLLVNSFPERFTARLGRSRSAQYGEVSVTLSPVSKIQKTKSTYSPGKYVLVVESPLILLNENGAPSPTINALQQALPDVVKVCNAAASIITVEQYNSIWKSKSGKYSAYKEGSSFLLEIHSDLESEINFIGEWNEQGFGRVRLEPYKEEVKYILTTKENPENKPTYHNLPNPIKSEILIRISETYERQKTESLVKLRAIETAKRDRRRIKLTNHQLGRLERAFQQSKSDTGLQNWVKTAVTSRSSSTKLKQLGEALKKARLLSADNGFASRKLEIGEIDYSQNFEWRKLYWITYFQTLRKLNKANEQV